MRLVLNDQFGYLLGSVEHKVDLPGLENPHSVSFDDVKNIFGKNFVSSIMESKTDENNVKHNTFLLYSDKLSY